MTGLADDVPDDRIVPVALPNGATVQVRATHLGGDERVASIRNGIGEITAVIDGLAEALAGTLAKAKPSKAAVEFGLELGVESGTLTALLVKGSGKANLKITLEWEASGASAA